MELLRAGHKAGCWAVSDGCSQQVGLLTPFSKKQLPASCSGTVVSFQDTATKLSTYQSNKGNFIFPFFIYFFCPPVCREERDVPGRCRQVAVWACGWRPPTPRAGNEPPKNGFLPQKHLLSEPFAVGVSARQVSRKKPAKRRCCSASARSEKGLKSLSEERGEKEKREKKKEHMCAIHLFRATHSANHPLHHSVPREKLLRNNL